MKPQNTVMTGSSGYPKRMWGCKLPNEKEETWGSLSSEVTLSDCDEHLKEREGNE